MSKVHVNSFEVDHLKLDAGLYLREVRWINPFTKIKIWDLRMRAPRDNHPINAAALHCIEHICALGLRELLGKKYIGFYVYGCKTGCAFVTKSGVSLRKVALAVSALFDAYSNITDTTDVPCLTLKECGNPSFADVEGARRAMVEYSHLLKTLYL